MFTQVRALSMEVIPTSCLIDLDEYEYYKSRSTTRSYWLNLRSLAYMITILPYGLDPLVYIDTGGD